MSMLKKRYRISPEKCKKIKLNIIEDKIKFQSKVNGIVVTYVKNSKTKVKKRVKPKGGVIAMFSSITNF